MKTPRKPGFTLVELLVVITIIAVLAALSVGAVTKMLAKAKATKEAENLRQMGPMFTIYASGNNMTLPPCKVSVDNEDGTSVEMHWHETLLTLLFPDTDPAKFKTKAWWDGNDTFIRNPLFEETATPRGWTPLNPGYGMNEMIAENLALASTGVVPPRAELHVTKTPLAALAEPGRTPLIAPCDNYFFRYDPAEIAGFKSGTLKDFLFEGKFPVLFVDGHVETVTPSEYLARKLYLLPMVPTP
jgi:prepilin-type N-terminal cleavage/methylation domain-containing protein/prepilin-type processing-associated H-X9-DG protein